MGRKKKIASVDETNQILKEPVHDEELSSVESVVKEQIKPRKISAKERVKNELDELVERNQKLADLLGKVKSSDVKLLESLNGEQKKLLAKQYMLQNRLIHVLKRRLDVWTEV